MPKLNKLQSELRSLADPAKAKILQRFFKTGEGEYGEGDVFLGVTVPRLRILVKKYAADLNLKDADKLLRSKIHEERLVALLVLVAKYQFGKKVPYDNKSRPRKINVSASPKQIYDFYLSHTKYINNWDLVDLTAPKIVGAYLRDKNKSILYKLAKSKNIWERRIAILATFDFTYYGNPSEALKISKMLINDKHDLIHKAAGWMLREAGKRCGEKYLANFLDLHHNHMPRTMLRYAIERLPKQKRLNYLKIQKTPNPGTFLTKKCYN